MKVTIDVTREFCTPSMNCRKWVAKKLKRELKDVYLNNKAILENGGDFKDCIIELNFNIKLWEEEDVLVKKEGEKKCIEKEPVESGFVCNECKEDILFNMLDDWE